MRGDEGLLLALTAKMWGGRPSSYAGISDKAVALALDDALGLRLRQLEKQPGRPEADVLATGQRYENADDWGVPLYDEHRQTERRRAFTAKLIAEGKIQ